MNWRSGTCLRCCLVIFAVISALCVSGPALYFKFKKGLKLKGVSASCAPCACHCAPPQSLFQIAPGLADLSVTDCGKDDPDLKEEMEKQFCGLIAEAKIARSCRSRAHPPYEHHLGEARRSASQYQREAEKCNAATETCEGARERAETLLAKEKRITLVWERRAKLLGWEG
ncbi:UNVERIFIED_CONTAM: hypothetical protein Scaly_2590700 [Sesamum calycinum]|uniref:Uncharacterized protein n=1 Tax=Sesamum calycinum TaxID=2727403 RepID=A0AAW2JD89_9LAMI